jgi:ABC-type Fe3+/spermidine/putrescine transport system ATPase subunit
VDLGAASEFTMLLGPNGAGKTTRLDGQRLAATG